MITVIELLSLPVFSGFRLMSGQSGLYNAVTGTGIFEWESPADVDQTFAKGEFVVTTLSQAKNDSSLAENCLRMLMIKGVSAIAIKTIYFKEISEELKLFSDLHKVPIFLFSSTFFDDVIFTIKNALITSNLNVDHTEKLKALLKPDTDSERILKTAREINPYFFNSLICCFVSLNDKSLHQEDIEQKYRDTLERRNCLDVDSSRVVYSMIQYERGILIIYTVKDPFTDLKADIIVFLNKLGIGSDSCMLGLSNIHFQLEDLSTAIKQSLYANASCLIDKEPLLYFDVIGLDKFLMPIKDNLWVKQYYDNFMEKILSHDLIHNSNLMETLIEYVKCNGDIQLTAKKTFQHSNTIRYRLDKAKKILNIEEERDSYANLFIFIRLYEIHNNLDKLI